MELGKQHHQIARQGDQNAVKQAEQLFEDVLRHQPNNTIALAYYGSIWTMKGRDAFLPWKKVNYAKKGLGYLDRAVALNPSGFEEQLVRAINAVHLPKFLDRQSVAINDFELLLKWVEKDQKTLNPAERAEFYFFVGGAFQQIGNIIKAKHFWRIAQEVSPFSEFGQFAKRRLDHTK